MRDYDAAASFEYDMKPKNQLSGIAVQVRASINIIFYIIGGEKISWKKNYWTF